LSKKKATRVINYPLAARRTLGVPGTPYVILGELRMVSPELPLVPLLCAPTFRRVCSEQRIYDLYIFKC